MLGVSLRSISILAHLCGLGSLQDKPSRQCMRSTYEILFKALSPHTARNSSNTDVFILSARIH